MGFKVESLRVFSHVCFIAFTVLIVIQPLGFVAFLPLLVVQYDSCRALPGRYNYAARFGPEVYVWVVSVVLFTASCLLTRGNQAYGRVSICLSKKKWIAVLSVMLFLACSCLVTILVSNLVAPEKEYFRTTLTQDIITHNASSEIDSIQNYFSCCGVDGPKSWQLNWKFNCSSRNGVCGMPQSCCIDQSNWTYGFGVWQNETLKSSNINKDGCLIMIEECFYGIVPTLYWIFFYITDSVYVILSFPCPWKTWKHGTCSWYQYMTAMVLIWNTLRCCCTRKRPEGSKSSLPRAEVNPTGVQTSLPDDDSSASYCEEANSANSCLITGWRLVCGCCQFRKSSDSEYGVSSSLYPTSLDANDEDNPITNGDDVSLPDLSDGDEIPLRRLYEYFDDVPVEQQLELDRLLRSSVAGPETISREMESPRSDVRLIQGDQGLSDMETAFDEIEKVVQATDTKNTLSSAFMSEHDREVLPIGELSLTVGPDGGNAHRGDLSLFVPAGAVDADVTLIARLYTSKHEFPHVDISKEEFVFSPVLSLEPQGYQFKQPVLPFSAVPGGWQLALLRADCRVEQVDRTWKEIVTYNSDTGEVTTDDCQFDVDHALLGVTHFCRHCWYGRAILNQGISYIKSRKLLYCSVFDQPDGSLNRWYLEVNFHDRCDDIFEGVLTNYNRLQQSWQLFGGPALLTIARYGEIKCEVESRSWKLDGEIEPQPFEYYWNEWFGNNSNKSVLLLNSHLDDRWELSMGLK